MTVRTAIGHQLNHELPTGSKNMHKFSLVQLRADASEKKAGN